MNNAMSNVLITNTPTSKPAIGSESTSSFNGARDDGFARQLRSANDHLDEATQGNPRRRAMVDAAADTDGNSTTAGAAQATSDADAQTTSTRTSGQNSAQSPAETDADSGQPAGTSSSDVSSESILAGAEISGDASVNNASADTGEWVSGGEQLVDMTLAENAGLPIEPGARPLAIDGSTTGETEPAQGLTTAGLTSQGLTSPSGIAASTARNTTMETPRPAIGEPGSVASVPVPNNGVASTTDDNAIDAGNVSDRLAPGRALLETAQIQALANSSNVTRNGYSLSRSLSAGANLLSPEPAAIADSSSAQAVSSLMADATAESSYAATPGMTGETLTLANPQRSRHSSTLVSALPGAAPAVNPAGSAAAGGEVTSTTVANTLINSATPNSASSAQPMAENTFHAIATGIVAAPATATGNTSGQAAALAPHTVPLMSPNAEQAMTDNIRWMVNDRLQNAVINVNPAGMGPISVQLGMENDQMSISITASQLLTKEALDSMLPRLREQLAAQGHVNVQVELSGGREEKGQARQGETTTGRDDQQAVDQGVDDPALVAAGQGEPSELPGMTLHRYNGYFDTYA